MISEDEYLLFNRCRLAQGDTPDLLVRVQSEVLQAWEAIALRSDEPEHPFSLIKPVAVKNGTSSSHGEFAVPMRVWSGWPLPIPRSMTMCQKNNKPLQGWPSDSEPL
jgi:hypothetical protein